MYESVSKKDIIAINKKFDKGTVINESSLDFALNQANQSKSWIKSCAILVRAVLIDHVFEEGNKRTAAGIITAFFEENNINYDPEKLAKSIASILTKNTTNIIKIEEEILNAIIR